jgi:hypothetical protein
MARHPFELDAQQRLDIAGYIVGVVADFEDLPRDGGGLVVVAYTGNGLLSARGAVIYGLHSNFLSGPRVQRGPYLFMR